MDWTQRFWLKVDRRGAGECWPWRACLVQGYGQFTLSEGRRTRAHRTAYELLVGPIPSGLGLDHLCRNRACCNPAHLEPVPNGVNVLRGIGRTAVNAHKTHCINGHELTPENTYRFPNGRRNCRQCRAAGRSRAAA